MATVISPMVNEDLSSALSLWAQIDEMELNESDTPEHLQGYLKQNPGLSMVVRDGQVIVGAILCGHDGRRGYLHHLAVAKEYRGRGLGKQLVASCLAALAKIGIPKCSIFVYADNKLGQHFWHRCGWLNRSDLQVLQRSTTN